MLTCIPNQWNAIWNMMWLCCIINILVLFLNHCFVFSNVNIMLLCGYSCFCLSSYLVNHEWKQNYYWPLRYEHHENHVTLTASLPVFPPTGASVCSKCSAVVLRVTLVWFLCNSSNGVAWWKWLLELLTPTSELLWTVLIANATNLACWSLSCIVLLWKHLCD